MSDCQCDKLAELLSPQLFKALSDPNRLALLVRLSRCSEPCSVSQLNECCPVDVSVVSRHLATLRDAGVLWAEKRGKEVFYSIRTEQLSPLLRQIADCLDACCPPPETPGKTSD